MLVNLIVLAKKMSIDDWKIDDKKIMSISIFVTNLSIKNLNLKYSRIYLFISKTPPYTTVSLSLSAYYGLNVVFGGPSV